MIDIIFGTRPEAIKLAILIKELKKRSIPHRVISTGQHKEMLKQVLDWFEITVDVDLAVMSENQSLAKLSATTMSSLQEFYDTNTKPSVVIVQGDTTTAFVGGLVGFYNKIKVAHVEAGLRTNQKWSPFPEEMNRKMLSQLADFHFAPTSVAYDALIKESIAADKVFETGNTVVDALKFSVNKVANENFYPPQLSSFFVGDQRSQKVVLITGHRRENFGLGFQKICDAIVKLAIDFPEISFIYPVHLNPNVQTVIHDRLADLTNVYLIEPLNYSEFISVMNRSFFIMTDSGGVQEEAPSLQKPVLVMRENTERTEGVMAGVVKLTGTNSEAIYNEAKRLLEDPQYYASFLGKSNPYGDGSASIQIIDQLLKDNAVNSL